MTLSPRAFSALFTFVKKIVATHAINFPSTPESSGPYFDA